MPPPAHSAAFGGRPASNAHARRTEVGRDCARVLFRVDCPARAPVLDSDSAKARRGRIVTDQVAPSTGQTFEEVRRALTGSEGGVEALDKRFRARLEIRFSMWMENRARFNPEMKRRIQVDDVVQETLVRAYRDLGQVKDGQSGSFWKWLCVVGRHAMLDAIRHATTAGAGVQHEKHAVEVGGQRVDPLAAVAARDGRPAHRAHHRDLNERLGRAIAGLPPRESFVIKEFFLSGRTLDEIGEMLGIQRVRAHQIKARALLQMKRALGGTGAFERLLATG